MSRAGHTLLRTPHGSHLYGLAHADSDYDYYSVISDKSIGSIHTIEGEIDNNIVSYDRFMRLCEKGVPQSLEAMFSRQTTIDLIPFIRGSFVAQGYVVARTYRRTIKNFWEKESFKTRRHALRLYLNYVDILEYGIFNPTLTFNDIECVNTYARQEDGLDIVRRMYGV